VNEHRVKLQFENFTPRHIVEPMSHIEKAHALNDSIELKLPEKSHSIKLKFFTVHPLTSSFSIDSLSLSDVHKDFLTPVF